MFSGGMIFLAVLHFPNKSIATTDEVRAAFGSGAWLDGCVNRQRGDPQNNGVPDDILVRYCVCTGDNLSKVITVEELKVMAHTPYANFSSELRARIYTAGLSCLEEMRSKCMRDSASHVTCKQ